MLAHVSGEKPQRGSPPRLLRAQSEARGWISDGLGCNIMAFPRLTTCSSRHITAKDYQTILEDHVHPMVQTVYPEGGAVYQDDNAPIHTARLVSEWFDERENEVEHLPWPAHSPDLNIIEPRWGILEK